MIKQLKTLTIKMLKGIQKNKLAPAKIYINRLMDEHALAKNIQKDS